MAFQNSEVMPSPISSIAGHYLLETIVAANDASLDFTTGLSSEYNTYRLVLSNFHPAADNAALGLRFSSDGGSTWDIGSGDYQSLRHMGYETGDSYSHNETSLIYCSGGIGHVNSEEQGLSGYFEFHGMNDSTLFTQGVGIVGYRNANGLLYCESTICERRANQVENGIQVIAGTGNIASGTVKLYGIK